MLGTVMSTAADDEPAVAVAAAAMATGRAAAALAAAALAAKAAATSGAMAAGATLDLTNASEPGFNPQGSTASSAPSGFPDSSTSVRSDRLSR